MVSGALPRLHPWGAPGSPLPPDSWSSACSLLPHLQHPLGTTRYQGLMRCACAHLARPGGVAVGSRAARVRPGTCWPSAWLSCARKCATKSGISVVGRAPPRHRARQDVEAVEWADRSAILPRAPCGSVGEGAPWDETRLRQERPHGRCGSRTGHGGLRSRSLGRGPLGPRTSPSGVCACWTVRGSVLVRWAMGPRTGSMLCCWVLEARLGRWPAPDHAWGRGRETCAGNADNSE
jgi:hypothetical protein